MEAIEKTIKLWHEYLETGEDSLFDEILAEDVVFHSPVVWTPQKGKAITKMYLTGARYVLAGAGKFRYVRKLITDNHMIYEFHTEVEGTSVEGVDMVTFNEEGKIIDFKVMLRPLQAVNKVHQKMGEMLALFKK